MTLPRRTVMAIALGCLVLTSVGLVFGVALDRIQFDRHRAEIMKPYEAAAQRWHESQIATELGTVGRHDVFTRQWHDALARIDDSVRVGNTGAAVAAWREAYRLAARSGEWSDMADVGDAALRIGDVPEFSETVAAAARRSYVTALYRADAARSVDGVLRAAEGFAVLGDRAVVAACLGMANRMPDSAPEARARLETLVVGMPAANGGS